MVALSLDKKHILTKFELLDYLSSNQQPPVYVVDLHNTIKFKIEYNNYNSVKFTNYLTDTINVIRIDEALSYKIFDNCQLYTLVGINKLLNILDKK
jgi:hypothetical protein